jgi:hypothetical protein
MKNLYLACITLLFVSNAFGQSSPGGVSGNLRWWLKADAGVLNPSAAPAIDGEAVLQWNDQSTILNNASQATSANRPVFRTNIINGNPVLRFSGDQFVDAGVASGITTNNSFYFFLVFKPSSFTAGGTGDGSGTYLMDRTTPNNPLTSFKIVNTDKYHFQKRNNSGGVTGPISTVAANTTSFVIADYFRNFNTALGLGLNGANPVTSGDDSGDLTADPIRVGRHSTTSGGGLTGDLAEVIVYNTNLTATQRQQVESYLAIKYGITMDQTTATDYLSSTGTVVFPATTSHDAYDRDIAGIAQDNGSGLLQSSSETQNALGLLRISSPSSLSDGDYLIWGHDSPNIWNSTNVPPGYANRLTRVWRMAETGDVGTVTVRFDLASLGIDVSDPTKFALLIDSDGNFSDATAHTTGRTIVGSVVTFTTASINNNDYIALATDMIPGPGGVAGPVIWLSASTQAFTDAGSTLAVDGQTVQQWSNQGSTTYNASQATAGRRPMYRTNVFNGNPVLRFTSAGATHTSLDFGNMGISSTSDLNFFIVLRPSVANGGAVNDGSGGYIFDRTPASASSQPLVGLKLLSTNRIGYQKRTDAGAGLGGVSTTTAFSLTVPQIVDYYRDYGVRYGIYHNGTQEQILAEADGPTTLPNLRMGTHSDGDKGFNGDIAEFIFYNADISNSDRNRIDSYLAIKYGITLNQASLTNYTVSDGTVVYPVTTSHTAHRFNIAGIGRDNVSRLNQTSSASVSSGIVRMQNPSALGNLEFMVWGDDNGSITTPNLADVGGGIQGRLTRIWKVAETGDVGTVDIVMDLTSIPGAKSQANLRLLTDRDGDGFADNDVTPLTGTLVGQIFTVTGVDFQHNDRFTIGSTNLVVTPLPVELLNFDVTYVKPVVEANWSTATELNNDFFTLERSQDVKSFDDVADVKGAGTTKEKQVYSAIDQTPLKGRSYYRLRQTDFDGQVKYSSIKVIEIETGFSVYPNPGDGTEFKVDLDLQQSSTVRLQLLNASGATVYEEVKSVVGEGPQTFSIKPPAKLSGGLYYLRVFYDGKQESVKLVVVGS